MNGQLKGSEAKNEEKMESMVCGRKQERQRKRERGRRKSTSSGKKNRRGKSREGGPVGDKLRKEGWLDRNWQNCGKKKRKKETPEGEETGLLVNLRLADLGRI